MDKKDFIKEIFQVMFKSANISEAVLLTIIDSKYIQHVDGKTLDFNAFYEHLKALKDKTKSIDVDFKTLVQEGNIVFSNHTVWVRMKDDSRVKMHVIAEFHIKNGKLFYCDELTALVQGDTKNKDLGSMR